MKNNDLNCNVSWCKYWEKDENNNCKIEGVPKFKVLCLVEFGGIPVVTCNSFKRRC